MSSRVDGHEREVCGKLAAPLQLYQVPSTPATMSKQHCRMLQVERCFDIVAVFGYNVERNIVFRQSRNKLNVFNLFRVCRKD